jgi:hypothetical protein
MIIAIVGLILFYVLPWFNITFEYEEYDGDKKKYSGNWDQDLEWKDGDKEMKEMAGKELYKGDSDTQDFIKGTIGLSFLGLIFALILGILAMVFGFIPMIHGRWPKVGSALDSMFGALTLLPAAMILFSGMRFLGNDISEMHQESVINQLGGEVSFWINYFAAYAMIVMGIIIFILALVLMKKGLNRLSYGFKPMSRPAGAPPPPPPPRDREDRYGPPPPRYDDHDNRGGDYYGR